MILLHLILLIFNKQRGNFPCWPHARDADVIRVVRMPVAHGEAYMGEKGRTEPPPMMIMVCAYVCVCVCAYVFWWMEEVCVWLGGGGRRHLRPL